MKNINPVTPAEASEASPEVLHQHYESLRNEIHIASSENLRLMMWMAGICGAVMYFCITKQFYPGLVIVFVISWVGLRVCNGNRKRIWRIASYLEIFLEPRLEKHGVCWETHLHSLTNPGASGPGYSSGIVRTEFWWFNILNLLALGAMLFVMDEEYTQTGCDCAFINVWFFSAILLMITFLLYSIDNQWRVTRHGKVHRQMRQAWKQYFGEEMQT